MTELHVELSFFLRLARIILDSPRGAAYPFNDIDSFHQYINKGPSTYGVFLQGHEIVCRDGCHDFVRVLVPENYPLKCKETDHEKSLFQLLFFLDVCICLCTKDIMWDKKDNKALGIIDVNVQDAEQVKVKKLKYRVQLGENYPLCSQEIFLDEKILEKITTDMVCGFYTIV